MEWSSLKKHKWLIIPLKYSVSLAIGKKSNWINLENSSYFSHIFIIIKHKRTINTDEDVEMGKLYSLLGEMWTCAASI